MRFTIIITLLLFLTFGCTKDDFAWNRLGYPEIGNLTVLENNLSYIHVQAQCFSAGNSKNTIRGFCWSDNEFPTINDNVVLSEGSGIGNFNAFIDWDGSTDTIRNIRAFCSNEIGTVYSNNIAILNPIISNSTPTVVTESINFAYSNSAEIFGTLVSDGGLPILEYGFCYSASNNVPDTSDSKWSVFSNYTGDFTTNLSGLFPSQTYYYRAYARNALGITYGIARNLSTNADYSIGDTGPGGGIVFYEKPTPSDGWQFMEVTPSDIGQFNWANGAAAQYQTNATDIEIGSGLDNTNLVEGLLNLNAPAAHNTFVLIYGSQNDWYLPSLNELQLLYNNLYTNNIGGLSSSSSYWSSTEDENFTGNAWYITFHAVGPSIQTTNKDTSFKVRAIRRF